MAGMKQVEQGNLGVQVYVTGSDELNTVANSFNQMARQRMDAEQRLKRSETFLSSVLEGIGEGVVVIDRNYCIVSTNQEYARQTKMNKDDIVGRHCYEISHGRKTPCFESEKTCECAVYRCFQSGERYRAVQRTSIPKARRKNGKEACDAIKSRLPDLKVLFMSGYTQDLINQKGILDTGIEFLTKPFTPKSLLEKVRHVLDTV